MEIKVKNKNIRMFDKEIYEVIAIIMQKKKILYLVQEDGGIPYLYEAKFFDVIDDKIHDYWVFKHYKYNNVIKSKKHMFSIILDMYIGPKELIDNIDFFFDIIDEKENASYILYDTLKLYGKQWQTPPQT